MNILNEQMLGLGLARVRVTHYRLGLQTRVRVTGKYRVMVS